MTDLSKQIRDDLEHSRTKLPGPNSDNVFGAMAADEWHAALLAVLDLHAPRDKGKNAYCECQIDDGVIWEHYPCDTVKAIAKGLGIEATDA